MEVTDIRIRRVYEGDGPIRMVVSVTFDGVFTVHDINVVQKDHRLFLGMPSRMTRHGTWQDVAHPITPEFRVYLEQKVFAACGDLLARSSPPDAP